MFKTLNALLKIYKPLLAGFILYIFAFPQSAYAGPFVCDGEIYQVQSGQLRIFDPIISAYVDVGVQQPAYNATGFNIQDNFAYGAQGTNVIRIHSDGSTEVVLSSGFTSFSGDVDDNNTLWLRRASNRYIGIELSTGARTDITFTGTVQNVADAAFFSDGSGRYLIGYNGTRTGIFNLDTGEAFRRDVSGGLPGGGYGATWTDFNGRIFTFNNGTGEIFEIFNPLSANPSAVLVAQGDPSGSNDGFSCNLAPFPNLPPLAFDDDYITPVDTPVVSNVIQDNGNGADEDPEGQGVTVTILPNAGTGPSNGSVTFSANGDFTYTPNPGFFGTDTFDYTITDITGLTATATVTILIEKADLSITKVASKTDDVELGDVITYTYTVTNTGNVDLSNVNVTDVHPGTGSLSAITPASASLSEAQSQVFTASYTVTEADIIAGTDITNTATAHATPASGMITEPTANETISPTAPAPEAIFSKLASPDSDLEEGDTVTYTYTVENTGNVTLTNTSISDVQSGTGTLSAITPTGVDIAPGASQDFTATYIITQEDFEAGVDITNTATLNTTPAAGTLATLTADESVSLATANPAATLTKLADDDTLVIEGQTITYTYTVENTGDVSLTGVTIADVHNGTGALSTITPASVDLAPTETTTFTATYVITQDDVDAGVPITNEATANATAARGTYTPPTANESVTVIAATPTATLTKIADKDVDVEAGDTITYTYVYTNTGNVTQTNLSISDVHNGAGTLSVITPATVAALLPNEDVSFTATYVVTQDDIDAGVPITNTATGNATPASGTLVPPTADESLDLIAPNPLATLTKTPDVSTDLGAGDTVTYTYTVENMGNVSLTNVSISDVHNGASTLSAITPATIATLAVGDSVDFTATYVITQDDIDAGVTITNIATLNATPAQGTLPATTANAAVDVEDATPTLTLTKTASDDTDVAEGDTITYTYVVTNTGNVDMTSVSVSDVQNGDGTLSAVTPASVDLAPTESQTFTATYIVTQGDIDAGTAIPNTATANATPARGTYTPITADEEITVEAATPLATLTKTASDDVDLVAGQTITYTYALVNTGNVTLTNASLTDVHSGTGTLSAITPASVATLAPTDSATFTATYVITQDDVDAQVPITNTASLSATAERGTLAPLTADESVTVESPTPLLTLVKTASETLNVQEGDVITYSYDVENTGNVTMDNVSISDVHSGTGTLSTITPASVSLAPGDTQTFTATYVVTQDDIDAGTNITNIATANAVPQAGSYTPITDDEVVTVDPASPDVIFNKIASKTAGLTVGETVTYTYDVENTGNVTLTSLSVADVHPGDGALSAITPASIASLAPGGTASFTATYVVTQGDIDAGVPIINTATLTATPTTGTLNPVTATETITPETSGPALALEKTADVTSGLTLGQTVTYTYRVTNTGNVTMSDISVSDVHTGTGALSAITPASVPTLAVGDSVDFTATYVITQDDVDAVTPITNIATVAATPPSGTYVPATDDESVTPIAAAPELEIVKTADVTANAAVGDVITYTYRVTNTGNVTVNNVMVSDVHEGTGSLGPISPANVATLAVGDFVEFTAQYTMTQDDIDAGVAVDNTATADATPVAGSLTPVTDTESVTPAAPNPLVDLTKTADVTTDLAVGDIVTYTYRAENTGNVTLTDVSVSDVHAGAGTLSAITPANIATLGVGQVVTFTATYEVTQADIDAGVPITNTAILTATPSGGTLPPTTDDESVTPEVAAPVLSLDKRALSTDFTMVGDMLDYEYDVVNTGNVTISALSVTDDRIASVSCPVTTLTPTESTVCTATYVVTQADLNAGFVTNIASVDGTPRGGTLTPPTDTETVDGTQSPLMTMVKTAVETDFAAVGDIINYEYLVTNTGNVEITALAIADDRIATVSCPVTTLAPTESTTCLASYAVTQADLDAGSVTNIAEATATPAGGTLAPVEDTETVNGTQTPELSLEKTALTNDFVAIGDILEYEYLVTNTGNVTITSSIHVDDDKIVLPSIVNCPALPAGGLAPTQSLVCLASYSVTQADLDAGEVTNIASASDGTTTSPTDQATVTGTQTPALTIDKVAQEADFAAVGDILTYEYTVTNTGNVGISTIAVTDDRIANVTCNVATVGNGDATLDPTEVVVCTGSYEVTQEDLNAGSVTNIASVTGTPNGGTLTPPTTSETVDAVQSPALTLVKTPVDTTFNAVGDVLSYTYTVTNTGNVLVSDIAVTDDKIASVTCDVTAIGNNDDNLDPTETVICMADYTVTQADLDAGEVINNAEATGTPAGGALTPAEDDATVAAVQSPALETVKTATNVNFELPGDITTYDYVVTNTGNVTITDPITVTDNLISNVVCPALPAGGLAPTASLTCTADYTVTQADLDAGQVTNLASASDGTTASPQTSETIPADQNPALSIVKRALFSDFTTAGEVVEYEFDVTNEGNLTLTGGIDVIDDKIGTISCFVGNLIPGATQTCTASYTVTQADVDAGEITNQAFAQNGTLVSAPVDVTVTGTATPSLSFDKRATTADFVNAGDVINYEFDVENTGNVTLNGVSVTDDIIANVTCPLTTLAPAQTMVCTASYTVTQADVDAGEVVNNASVAGTPPGGGTPTTTADTETVDSDPQPGLSFAKRALSTGFNAAGDILSYEFDVENTGSITLSNIVVTDDIIANVSCPLTTLAPAQTMVCTANYTVTQADVDAGEVINNAAANADLPNGDPLPELADSVTVDGEQTPALDVVKNALTIAYDAVGDVIDFEIIVTNTGNVTVSSIIVDDPLVPNLSCPTDTLAPSESFTCTGSYSVTQADIDNGDFTNTVSVTGTAPDGPLSPIDTSAIVVADIVPGLGLEKTALTADFSSVGDTVDYEYLVRNTGNVTITDPISVTDDKIASVNCPALPSGGLAPTASLTCMATYVVTQADLDAGQVTNIASASDGTTTSPDDTATVNAVQAPSLAMTKTADPQTYAAVGDTVTYSYVITNTGNVTITNALSVSDDRIASVSCPALPAGGLLPNASLTCTGTDIVTQADLDNGSVTNRATATDGTTPSNTVDETVTADQAPELAIEKSALSANFSAVGEIVDYEYLVTNTGNVTITEPITVSDDRIASVSCPALPGGSLAPTASIVCTGRYEVTQADLDAGEVTNIASARTGTTVSPTDAVTLPADQTPDLSIVKSALETSYAAVGDVLSYEYRVRNTGNVTLSGNISVTDDRIANVICPALPASGLAPQVEIVCDATYLVTQADLDAGQVINVASASNGTTTSSTDSATVNADDMPALSILKSSDLSTFSTPGEIITYSFVVTNSGNITLTDPVTVSDDRIPNVTCPALPANGLVPGASITCTGTDTVEQADIDAGVIENTASAASGGTTSDEAIRRVFATRSSELVIEKTATDINFTLPGDIVMYEYVVTNTGNVTITDPITVSDNRIPNVVCPALPAGGLAPNASLTCTADYVVTQDNLDVGVVVNIATATDGTVTSAPDSETIPANANPAMEIRKSSTDAPFTAAGDILTYLFEVENTGNVTLTGNITVVDNRIGTFVCYTGNFIPGKVESCTAEYTVTQADVDRGEVTNDAFATHPRTNSPTDFVTIPANQRREIGLMKDATTTDFANVGDTIDYIYTLTNLGNVTITLPLSVSDDRIANVSCDPLPAGGLLPNATLECRATDVVTQADIDAGFVTNTATATDGITTSGPVTETVNGTQTPAISLEKLAQDSDFTAVGDALVYNYIVTNTGNVTLTEPVTITDDRIGTISCPALPAGGLVPSATLLCTGTDNVTQADLDAGFITNIAEAQSGTTGSNTDTATVEGTQTPSLDIVKTASTENFTSAGDIVSYDYVVTNTGNVTLTTPITVSDDKIANVTCPALPVGGLIPAMSLTCLADYTVTQADVDAGFVTNLASATDGTTTSGEVSETVNAQQQPSLSLVKTALTTEFAQAGDTLDYEYVVTNTGNVTITQAITISDDRIVSVTCPVLPAGGLLPTQSLTCTATDTLDQADIDAGSVTNLATATDGTTSSNEESETVAGNSESAFTINKVAQSNDFTAVGDVLAYDYIIRNTGNVTLTEPFTVSDDKIGEISCPVNTGLVPNATLLCSATYSVTQEDLDAGEVINVATASSGGVTSDPDEVTITGTQTPALMIEKSTDTTSLTLAGQTVSYDYLVTNIGNTTFTTPITVSDDKIANVTCPTLPAEGLAPTASLTCTADYTVTQADLDAGFVTNIATASSGGTTSEPDSVTVETDVQTGLDIVKRATTEGFASVGDIVSYEYDVTNTGNLTLTTPITVSDDKIATVNCPALPAGGLAPQASLTCSADYSIVQADLDAGQVTNLATAASGPIESAEVSETVAAMVTPELDVTKTTTNTRQLFGPIFEVTYDLSLENTGNVTLTNVQLEDDLAASFAPATMFGSPVIEANGVTANGNYDGVTITDLLAGLDRLNVGEVANLTLTAQLDITNGGPAQGNTAYGTAAELSQPVPSDDFVVTPDSNDDTNPAPLVLTDADGDGAPDQFESPTADRDGDGIPDSMDYDPTGYFYCEENGSILAGGGISVTGPVGTNSAIGTANNIVIVQDGSNGFYQFYVTAPGRYTLTPTYPDTGLVSTARLPEADFLDVSTRTDNPAILGSSEVGNSGQIADFSADANAPFYFEFEFEAGDPSVLLNNIPLRGCGVPAIELAKSSTGDPERLDDGRQLVSYNFDITNTGETLVEDIRLEDDLAAVFGAGRVEVQSLDILSSPDSFAGQTNPAYDGEAVTALLIGAGDLNPGEALSLNLQAAVNPAVDGEYTNIATVSATGPRDTGDISGEATATIELLPLADASFLRVTKTASPRTVQIGDPILYTISVTNESASTLTGVDIVDRLPEGFAYVPNSSRVADATDIVELEPVVRSRGVLSWSLAAGEATPLDALQPGETVSVNLQLLAGPNVTFGAHENQAFAENMATGTRSEIATAVVDYIPEPSFDCTPVIGRVYDDVNVNGYPDDGEPGLPGVRLVTVNGDIITTDEYGRYHIPCAILADSENGSNFLLKADTRTLPLGYAPTTENPRVVRATRGKFVKMNFGAGFRTKLRVDFNAADFNADGTGIAASKVSELREFLTQNDKAERAVLVFKAADDMNVDAAQARLQVALEAVRDLASKSLQDIALEASWGEAKYYEESGEIAGEVFGYDVPSDSGEPPAIKDNGRENGTDRQAFAVNDNGSISPVGRDALTDSDEDRRWNNGGGLRDNHIDQDDEGVLDSDTRENRASVLGRRDRVTEIDQSPAPGRLQRWLGWGNSTSAYVDSMEIETTVDSLDPVKRLNAQLDVVNWNGERQLKASTYSNYAAFTDRLEIRVFDARRSARGEPLYTMDVTGDQASMALPNNLPDNLLYVLRAYGKNGAFDDTAPKNLRVGEAEFDLTETEWLAQAPNSFGQNTLQVSNILVRGGAVRVYGRNVAGTTASVMGEQVRVDEQGRFVIEQLLPAGEQSVMIEAGGQTIARQVDVKARETFYVAQVEATIGQRIGDDDTFEEGRVAFYVRSRLNDRWTVTATADTGEAGLSDIISTLDDKDLDQLLRRLDPDRYYPTYGDNSVIEQDAPTSGRIYARIERDDDYALWGNYQTNFNDTEFARVNRTLYGAKLHWDENGFTTLGDARTALTAFIAEGGTRQARDELRGTGGSVYYLRHGDISIGSELLRVETRDSVSGLVIESRRLTYGTDYDLDFIQGRVILTRPLGSTGDDGRLFRDGSLSGNAQVLVADYEFTPVFGANDNGAVYGARVRRWFGDHVKLGATYNHSDDGGVESDLYEMDLTLQYAAGTYIKGEIARSEGVGVETFTSVDGGFTYNSADRGGLTDDADAMAYALEAAVNFSEVSDLNGSAYSYWRKREAGFGGYAEATNSTVEQFGGGLNITLARGLELGARADISDSEFIGTNSFAEARLDYELNEKVTLSGGLSYNDDTRGNSGSSLGGRAEYAISDDTNLYAFGQVGLTGDNTRTTDRLGVGGEVRLSKTFYGGGEVSTGEDGLGVRASLRREEEDGDEYYLAYDLPLRAQATSNFGTFNIGARKRYGDALSIFGEERLQFNDRGLNGVTHAYGVEYKPGNWNFGLNGEVGRIDQLDREAFGLSTGFANDRFKAGFAAEWREDTNVDTDAQRQTWLLRATSQYQASEELRLQGKFNRAVSSQTEEGDFGPIDFNEAEFVEGSVAAAYRPIWDDRFNLLAKYTYLEDLSPTSQRFGGETLNYRQISEIVSIDASYDVSSKWTLGGKYAHRSGAVTSNRESLDFTRSSADLGVLRLDYHVTHQWDIHLEGRWLDIGNGVIERVGGQAGIYRHMNDNAKLGLGVTWGGIEEEYLGALEDEDDIGWYLNFIGKF